MPQSTTIDTTQNAGIVNREHWLESAVEKLRPLLRDANNDERTEQ